MSLTKPFVHQQFRLSVIALSLLFALSACQIGQNNSSEETPDTFTMPTPEDVTEISATPTEATDGNSQPNTDDTFFIAINSEDLRIAEEVKSSVETSFEENNLGEEITVILNSEQTDTISSEMQLSLVHGDVFLEATLVANPPLPEPSLMDEDLPVWLLSLPQEALHFEEPSLPILSGITLGYYYIAQEEYELAENTLRPLLATTITGNSDLRDNNQAYINFLIGYIQSQREDWSNALRTYSQCIRLQEDFLSASANRGAVYLSLGDTATAKEELSQSILHPTTTYNLGLTYLQEGNFRSAIDTLDELPPEIRNAAFVSNARSIMLYQLGEFEQAIAELESGRTNKPSNIMVLQNLGTLYLAVEDFESALDVYTELVALNPESFEFLLQQGLIYLTLGEEVQAIAIFEQTILLAPEETEAYLQLASIRYENSAYDDVLNLTDHLIELNENDPRSYVLQGNVYLVFEEYPSAEEAFDLAIKYGDEQSSTFSGRAYAYLNQEKYTKATGDFVQAVELGFEGDAEFYYLFSISAFNAEAYSVSLGAIQESISLGFDEPEAYALLAVAFDANIKRAEAEEAYREAIKLSAEFINSEVLADLPYWNTAGINRAATIIRRLDLESETED